MLKPIHLKTFVRNMAIIQIGFALFGISIAMFKAFHVHPHELIAAEEGTD
jgi:hypothetical protein